MIDWDLINCVRPGNNEILKYSRGEKLNEYCVCCFEHMNWAFKVSGYNKVVTTRSTLLSDDFAILVSVCQKIVKEENIQYTPESKKKKGWFW